MLLCSSKRRLHAIRTVLVLFYLMVLEQEREAEALGWKRGKASLLDSLLALGHLAYRLQHRPRGLRST